MNQRLGLEEYDVGNRPETFVHEQISEQVKLQKRHDKVEYNRAKLKQWGKNFKDNMGWLGGKIKAGAAKISEMQSQQPQSKSKDKQKKGTLKWSPNWDSINQSIMGGPNDGEETNKAKRKPGKGRRGVRSGRSGSI
jgi:hypothetical protein